MTDIAFEMTKRVWQDLPAECRGNCYFCIGGVNAINPFSATAVKNEIVVYVDAIPKDAKQLEPKEGAFYDMGGKSMASFELASYDEIYMDFNGSMAFFNEEWQKRLRDTAIVPKVHYLLLLVTRIFNSKVITPRIFCFLSAEFPYDKSCFVADPRDCCNGRCIR